MKFGKNLKVLIEEAPEEWQDKYLRCKDLKKRLKVIFPRQEDAVGEEAVISEEEFSRKRRRIESVEATADSSASVSNSFECSSNNGSNGSCVVTDHDDDESEEDDLKSRFTSAECDFIGMLKPELEKLNDFFVEKETEFIIRHKELVDGIERVRNTVGPNGKVPCSTKYRHDVIKFLKDVVDFHGEVVLLVCYSIVNFTGMVKILKKCDKRTGGVLRVEYMQKVLEQPFFAVEQVFKMVKDCEKVMQELFAEKEEEEPPIALEKKPEEDENGLLAYLRKGDLNRRIEAARRTPQHTGNAQREFHLQPLLLTSSPRLLVILKTYSPLLLLILLYYFLLFLF